MTGPNVAQRIQVVSLLLHEAKLVLGIFCLNWTQLVEVVMWQVQYAKTIGWGL